MSDSHTSRNGPGSGKRDRGQNTAAVAGFLANLLEGTVALLAPSLRQLPAWSPAPAAVEISAEQLIYEPLRVMGPRVVHSLRRFASRISISWARTRRASLVRVSKP